MNVLHPMGWDAFGLPAENAAMERGVHPGAWTYQNIAAMKAPAQVDGPEPRLDAARSPPAMPSYYRHQQKMFLDFLEAGLVTRKQSKVNWDPVDMTVLANEQVIDGRGWRSGALVEQRELTQWFFKISDFAEELLQALDTLDRLARQGAHHAAQLDRQVRRPAAAVRGRRADRPTRPAIEVFTTRPDTIFGAVLHRARRPTIRWPTALAANDPAIAAFVDECHRSGTATEAHREGRKEGRTPPAST